MPVAPAGSSRISLLFRPWRSAALGWAVAAVALAVGVPLFLRMPPWCDLTLYDVAAHNLLRGGTHYRDVFDTNPPGFVCALTGIRLLLGDSYEAVRAVDLAVVAGIVFVLAKWVRAAGGTPASVAWMAAGAALFYPFASEYNHAQRDVWMLLPVAAVGLRRVRRAAADGGRRFVLGAVLEGFVLGLAAWTKPHALVPAAAVWLVTLPRVAGRHPRPGRAAAADFFANLAGGLAALGLGLAWLVGSGTWGPFAEVFTFWNPGYFKLVFKEFNSRTDKQLFYFPPWSLFQPVALVFAVVALARGRWWRGTPRVPPADPAGGDPRFARAALAALFLAWVAQGYCLQREFPYVHVPETLLMLAVFAAAGYCVGYAGLVLAAVATVAVVWFEGSAKGRAALDKYRDKYPNRGRVAARHPLADPRRLAWWPACWRAGLSPQAYRERRNGVAFQVDYFAGIDWVQLGEVADYLTAAGPPGDGEVIAWHDSPHAIYLLLGIQPGFRFMHVSTVTGIGEPQYERLRDELHAVTDGPGRRAKWVVADLERVFGRERPGLAEAMGQPGTGGGDLYPPALRAMFPNAVAEFPFDQPAVFRSAGGRGRYILFRLTNPVTPECRISGGLGSDIAPPPGR